MPDRRGVDEAGSARRGFLLGLARDVAAFNLPARVGELTVGKPALRLSLPRRLAPGLSRAPHSGLAVVLAAASQATKTINSAPSRPWFTFNTAESIRRTVK
jgi:hypothetical protein